MATSSSEYRPPRVIKANYMLQAKIGAGPLDVKKVEAAQKIIKENNVDFSPMAKQYLEDLQEVINKASDGSSDLQAMVQEMTQPVMELKANAAVFGYDLVGNLASVMLSFLEAVKSLDKTVIEIVQAHHKTLSAIIANKMKGDGGPHGKQLEQELKDACLRYFQKKKAG
tara:strand:- start:92 stop:598 length:507 start_codon:yes stop_codon:yes gene_type:complete